MRDMIKTAEKVESNFFEKKEMLAYDMTFDEFCTLFKIANSKDTRDPLAKAIMIAFRYGFVLGHRATVAGKVKKKL